MMKSSVTSSYDVVQPTYEDPDATMVKVDSCYHEWLIHLVSAGFLSTRSIFQGTGHKNRPCTLLSLGFSFCHLCDSLMEASRRL